MRSNAGPKTTTIRYLEPSRVRAWRPAGSALLRIELAEDRTIVSAIIKRVFPLSNESAFLSIQEKDGHEVGILKSLEGVDSMTRESIEAEFDRRYYTPKITQITTLVQEAGMWRFDVKTQRGEKRFFVRNWRDSAFEMNPGRWHILSVDGGRYELQDLSKLDEVSQRLLELLL